MLKSQQHIEPRRVMRQLITNPQMTYNQLVSFIGEFLHKRDHHTALLTQQEMQDYRASIKNDPLLEELLNQYLPYSRKWQPIVWRSVQAYPEPVEVLRPKNVHDVAFAGPRAMCKKWLAQNYPHNMRSQTEKKQAISNFFEIIIQRVEQGLHDSSLLLQEKQRVKEVAAENRENLSMGLPSSNAAIDINKLRIELKEYILFVEAGIDSQTAGVEELLSLREWIKQPLTPDSLERDDRFAIIVEALDESRTAYYAGGSFMGKKYSCPIGLEERLLDRAIFIMASHTKDKLLTEEEILIKKIVGRFIQRDHESESFIPTNAFYQSYLTTAGWSLRSETYKKWSLLSTQGDRAYQQALDSYIFYKKNKIYQDMGSYQSEKAYREHQKKASKTLTATEMSRFSFARLLVLPYFDSETHIEALVSDTALERLLEAEFEIKIQRCLSWDGYVESLGQEQDFFCSILACAVAKKQSLVLDEGSQEQAFDMVIKKMGRDIGFDSQHIELLLAIISKLDPGVSPEESGFNILRSYAENNILSIPGQETDLEHNQWYHEAYDLYISYLDVADGYEFVQPFISILPADFNNTSVLEALNSQLNYREQGIKCSGEIFKRLWSERKIQLYNYLSFKTALLKATQANSLPIIRAIIQNSSWYEGFNHVLLCAAEYGYVEIMKEIIQNTWTCELSLVDSKHRSVWDLAALRGQLEVLLLLEKEYPCLSEKVVTTGKPLMFAIKNNQGPVVEFLLHQYESLRNSYSMLGGYTFLMAAAEHGFVDIAEKIISYGADLSVCDKNGQNCLFYAVAANRLQLVLLLLQHRRSFDINTLSGHNETVLSLAIKKGYAEITLQLLRVGAMLYVGSCAHKELLCNTTIGSGHLDVVAALFSEGYLDLTYQDSHGGFLLHRAAKLATTAIIEFLIDNGAAIENLNYQGQNFLMFGLKHRTSLKSLSPLLQRPEITVRFLNSRDYHGNTALHYATVAGDLRIIESLIKKGVELFQINCDGQTALMLAAELGLIEITQLLLSQQQTCLNMINLKDENKESAVQKAINRKQYQVVELLLSYGAYYHQYHFRLFSNRIYYADYMNNCVNNGDFRSLFTALSSGARATVEHLISAVDLQSSGMVGLLLAQGVKLPKAVNNQQNLLMRAAQLGDIKTVRLLLPQMIYTLGFKNEDGLGAYEQALRAGHEEIAVLLHSHASVQLRPYAAPKIFSRVFSRDQTVGVFKKFKVAPNN